MLFIRRSNESYSVYLQREGYFFIFATEHAELINDFKIIKIEKGALSFA